MRLTVSLYVARITSSPWGFVQKPCLLPPAPTGSGAGNGIAGIGVPPTDTGLIAVKASDPRASALVVP